MHGFSRFFQRPTNQNASLLKLPPEVLLHILSYLPQAELINLSLVCYQLAIFSEDNYLWQPFLPPNHAAKVDGDLKRSVQILQHIEKYGHEYGYSSWAKATFKFADYSDFKDFPSVSSLFADASNVGEQKHIVAHFYKCFKETLNRQNIEFQETAYRIGDGFNEIRTQMRYFIQDPIGTIQGGITSQSNRFKSQLDDSIQSLKEISTKAIQPRMFIELKVAASDFRQQLIRDVTDFSNVVRALTILFVIIQAIYMTLSNDDKPHFKP